MIVGTHTVIASKDPDADYKFFREVLGLSSIDAGGGYIIFGLPRSEASVHETDGEVPHHELYFLCDDIESFKASISDQGIECSDVRETGWGRLVKLTTPSGAPLHVYQPRHARP